MDFPAVVDLLEYWLECPPEHLLLRGMAQYEGKKERGNWRKSRAEEMGDKNYKSEPEQKPSATQEDVRMALESFTGARNLDCAPGHIQEAIARFKRGEHLVIPPPQ